MIKRIKGAWSMLWGNVGSEPYLSARNTIARSNPNAGTPTDAKQELRDYSRLEMISKSRFLEKNSGLFRGILRDQKVYGIGSGIYPNAKSLSEEWNTEAERRFYEWSRNCEITGRFSWRECQGMIIRLLMVDGEAFVVKTRDEYNEPKIQIIEAHRVGANGIEYDKIGRVVSYKIRTDGDNERVLPASSVIHIYDRERPSASRGIPHFQHSINNVIDLDDILALEKRKVKAVSDIVHVIQSSRPADDGGLNLSADAGAPETPIADLDRIIGGKNIRIQEGETFTAHQANIPSPTFAGFADRLERIAAMGVLPYEFSVDVSRIGGAGVRMIASKAQRYIDDTLTLLDERFNDAVWFYVIGHLIDAGELPAQVGWWNATWTHPQKLTVDAGREETQNRANIEMGLKSLSEAFAERGLDFEEEARTRARDFKFLQDTAKEFGVPLWVLYKPQMQGITPADGKEGAAAQGKNGDDNTGKEEGNE